MTKTRQTILIVDPNPSTRTTVSRELTSMGYMVLEATDGTRAMEILRERKIRLVVAELYLKTGDNDCLVQAMRRDRVRTRTVAHTVHAKSGDRAWAKRWGAGAYLIQPAAPERLRSVVSRLLSVLSAGPAAKRVRLTRRDTLESVLSEIERGSLQGTSSVVFGRPWWSSLTAPQRNAYRHRAKRAGISLRADSLMASDFVELRAVAG